MMITVKDLSFVPFISKEEIAEKIAELGTAIQAEYVDQEPLFIGVLNGAFLFAADLLRACGDMPCEIFFVKLSSYEGMASTGKVISVIGVKPEIVKDRAVIILEDIVDTGKTMTDFMQTIASYQPKSMALVTLFHKPDALQYEVKIDHIGFSIPDKFIVGYGLDYDGFGRNLSDVYQLAS
jgi:hypoxanthine phosphoribosyltransferase